MGHVDVLAAVNRWVGVTIAVVGTSIAAPDAVRRLARDVKTWWRRVVQQARAAWARLTPFWHRSTSVTVTGSTAGSVAQTLPGLLTVASGRTWDPSTSADERIDALRRHITEVEHQVDELRNQQRQDRADHDAEMTALRQLLIKEADELRALLVEREQRATLTDARGLPVIAIGIVLSGVPDDLASIPYGLGELVLVLGLAITLRQVWSARKDPVVGSL